MHTQVHGRVVQVMYESFCYLPVGMPPCVSVGPSSTTTTLLLAMAEGSAATTSLERSELSGNGVFGFGVVLGSMVAYATRAFLGRFGVGVVAILGV
jgi:hypothetical protein